MCGQRRAFKFCPGQTPTIRAMEEKIATLIEQIPIGIITYSYNGNVEFINQNFKKFSILYQITMPHQHFNVFENDLFPDLSIKDELRDTLEGISFIKEVKIVRSNNGGSISIIAKGNPIYEEDKITITQIKKAIEDEGYKVK
jgi:PAS domain-containing protein